MSNTGPLSSGLNTDLLNSRVTVYFIDRDGDKIVTQATVGTSLLTVAIDNEVELEGIIMLSWL